MSTGYAPLGPGSGPCEREGCDEPSAFLIPAGRRCEEHAREEEPETVELVAELDGRGDH